MLVLMGVGVQLGVLSLIRKRILEEAAEASAPLDEPCNKLDYHTLIICMLKSARNQDHNPMAWVGGIAARQKLGTRHARVAFHPQPAHAS